MFKLIAKNLARGIGWTGSLLVNYYFVLFLKLIISYTQWFSIKNKFKHVGNNSEIRFPSTIINPKYIELGSDFSTLERFRIEAYDKFLDSRYSPEIIIGNNVSFGTDCHVACIEKITIGNNVLAASRVFISDHFHGSIDASMLRIPPSERPLFSKGPVVIEDNVWIGQGVVVLPGCRIGRNSIIGSNAVVACDIPSNCVAVGVPAKVIKNLSANNEN